MTNWMIYGATGYTGRLIAEAAVERGHKPLLAGRSADKLHKLAQRLNLDYVVFRLDEQPSLADYEVNLVLNCAGPFVNTATSMQQACLAAGVHYLDITVETSVVEQTLALDAEARQRGIMMMSGVGFDTIPADCLAKYVSDQVPGATSLEIVLDFQLMQRGELGFTSGTLKSIMGILPAGVRVRRNGSPMSFDLGAHGKVISFPDGPRRVVPVPCGDVCTVYHATGIPNITAYIALPDWVCYGLRIGGGLAQFALRSALLRRGLRVPIERLVRGPSESRRQRVRALVGARAFDSNGHSAGAWLETLEPYHFSVSAALLTVEQVLARPFAGALTPSMAFGADFVLEIAGARRWNSLS
ncbi:MAG: saccharopine dehydrogenase NADP-binding domain-containing protein [Anaerolineae bacterium]|nr:saccharopine dehydrogenase NADP-binding domain-containing protein [Anaerolineae bacterium]